MTLENTFYILAIIVMVISLILLIALVIAVFVIRNKVITIEKQIQDKIDEITNFAGRGGEIVAAVGGKVASTAADAVLNMLDNNGKKSKKRR